MVKTTRWTELPQLLLIALMFVASALVWPYAEDRIPTHWNASGEVDRYGDKIELFVLPAITAGLYLLLRYIPRIDPKKSSYNAFVGAYTAIRISMVVFMAALHGVMLYTAIDAETAELDIGPFVTVGIGVLFIVIGLVLGKVQPNWFVGIRTPWTLSSTRSWARTHRLGGWLFIAMGLLMIVVGLIEPELMATVVLAATLGSVAIMFAYSYLEWRKDPDRDAITRDSGRGPRDAESGR